MDGIVGRAACYPNYWGQQEWQRQRCLPNGNNPVTNERRANMTKLSVLVAMSAAALAASTAARSEDIRARLIGFQEVPSVSTVARGEFEGQISRDDKSIDWEMTFGGLQAPITQSHIHVAQRSVNGSVVIWLCGTAANPGPTGTQSCPASGTISGRITAANVIAG